jgi:3-deoxy-manno-octulosonate cytidylyltransferase (CMP-KDO synthetase)
LEKPKILAVIPARYASTRLPGKALLPIGNKAMVAHVYERTLASGLFDHTIVATDNILITNYLEQQQIPYCLTAASHQNGTERCAEVANLLPQKYDYIVNVQGDEPFIKAEQLGLLVSLLSGHTQLATLVKKIDDTETLTNPNTPKVVLNQQNEALYFSRQTIPHLRDTEPELWLQKHNYYKHIGLYAYRTDVLPKIVALPLGILENAEKLEQLRWLEHGYKIKVAITPYDSMGIDTPADLQRARTAYEQYNF